MNIQPPHQRVVVTGCGLVSSLGASPVEVWDQIHQYTPEELRDNYNRIDGFVVHDVCDYDASEMIKTRAHIRGMGSSQRNTSYAAGLALQQAGIIDHDSILERTNVTIAVNDGMHDDDVEQNIFLESDSNLSEDQILIKNFADFRPSLFLTILPNLFAGNLSITHKVLGSSVTFIGEEIAGANALESAYCRIRSGIDQITLVGASSEAERKHVLAGYAARGLLQNNRPEDLYKRETDGIRLGTASGFLVLESEDHARERGAKILCELKGIQNRYGLRTKGSAIESTAEIYQHLYQHLSQARNQNSDHPFTLSSSHLLRSQQEEEQRYWDSMQGTYRNISNYFGGLLEASQLVNAVMGIQCIQNGSFIPPTTNVEQAEKIAHDAPVDHIWLSNWGLHRGESLALLGRYYEH